MNFEILDVVIVGAGVSGISSAFYLQQRCPTTNFTILEGRNSIGGTWDLFKYPGVRSDSSMHSYSFSFNPWSKNKSYASGQEILEYLMSTVKKFNIERYIQFNHQVTNANWDSQQQRWLVTVNHNGQVKNYKCKFLLMCAGYYNYSNGYTPDFKNFNKFSGTVVHPQQWPSALDYSNKRVAIIGSGATAIGLAPALTSAKSVSIIQRSPGYIESMPQQERGYNLLPQKIFRWKSIIRENISYLWSRILPKSYNYFLLKDTNLPTPRYNAWDQRVCVTPDNEFINAVNNNQVNIITDEIDSFTELGIKLVSGKIVEADIVVTATGFNIQLNGGIAVSVDQKNININRLANYRGMMINGVPNFMYTLGYFSGTWTLKAELVSKFACRVIQHLTNCGFSSCTPIVDSKTIVSTQCVPGYIARGFNKFPKSSVKSASQYYLLDLFLPKFTSNLRFK